MAKKKNTEKTVIVGTYRPENEAWIAERRLYNLPLPKCGKLAFHEAVSGIVLFAEGHRNFAFKARFKDVVELLDAMVNGKRLKDISDLPLDLAC